MTRLTFTAAMLWLSLLVQVPRSVCGDEREDFFEAKIRPVLVGTCFRCHSPTKTSGGLRIDARETLLKGGESGPAIVPGKPAASLLIRAIERQEDVSAMPPEKEKSLRPDQVADFSTWIKAGAVWPAKSPKFEAARHWSFEPIRDVPPPKVKDPASAPTSIDAFLQSRREAAGIGSAPQADKLALIRRATFDLTGLPPTPDDIVSFLQDTSPRAFEAVVERLLESPAYGERWGRHWLDVVRYADTAGETADYPVPLAWRYRNYVIDSFNADKPFDEFLREQIAGDVLAGQGPREKYAERVTATGYLAISRRFGFDSENYQHLTIQDTIDTLGQSVLGLSLGCARCHDHKFDPLSMRDYYGLYGIFASSRYAFPGSEQKQRMRSLAALLPPSESQPKWREYEARLAELAGKLAEQKQPVPQAVLRSLTDLDGDFELQAAAAGGSNGVLVSPWLYAGRIAVTNAAQSPFKNVYPRGNVGASVPAGVGAYRIEQAIYLGSPGGDQAAAARGEASGAVLHVNLDFRVVADSTATGVHRFALGGSRTDSAVEVLISFDAVSLRRGETIEPLGRLTPNQWHNLQLSLDRTGRTVLGKIATPEATTEFTGKSFSPAWSGGLNRIVFDSAGQTVEKLPTIEYDNLGVQESPLAPVSTAFSRPAADVPATDVEKAKREFDSLLTEGPFPMTYGMAEGTPHDVPMQMRGEPDQPGEIVARGFIQVLGGGSLSATTAGSGRLELAEWLTRPDNPLTARVMANRLWQYHFGRGLVKTPNDFGVRGLPPTHPELLDHLAMQFIRSGWSIKAMHRRIMQTAAYQQASVVDGGAAKNQGANGTQATEGTDRADLYLAFARRRLSAEEIRDSILAVSGELDRTPGGEHPFPAAIHWGYTQHGPFSAVYDHNRRSVYLMTQRLKRHPFLALFDGPDPNATTAERLGTTVPTQALFFLNDPFIHVQADRWAARLLASQADDTQRLEQAFRSAFGRAPTEIERDEATLFLADYRAELAAMKMDAVEARSLAAFLRTMFGSNEFLHVD